MPPVFHRPQNLIPNQQQSNGFQSAFLNFIANNQQRGETERITKNTKISSNSRDISWISGETPIKPPAPVDDPPPPENLPGKKKYIPPYTPNRVNKIPTSPAVSHRPQPSQSRPRAAPSRPVQVNQPKPVQTSSSMQSQMQNKAKQKHRYELEEEDELEVESKLTKISVWKSLFEHFRTFLPFR